MLAFPFGVSKGVSSSPRKLVGWKRRRGMRPRLEVLEDRIVLNSNIPTTTLLSIAPTGLEPYGASLTMTATVQGDAYDGGSVTFDDGTTALKTVAVSGTTAEFVTSSLAVGTHSITAHFNGFETGGGLGGGGDGLGGGNGMGGRGSGSTTIDYEPSTSSAHVETITIPAGRACRPPRR